MGYSLRHDLAWPLPGHLALRVRREACLRRRLGGRRAAGRHRSRRGDDRRAHLRPLSRGDQPLGRRRPLCRAGSWPGLRGKGLRGLLDALRHERRCDAGRHGVRAGRAQRAAHRAGRHGRNTPGPGLRRSGTEVRRLAVAPSRAGDAGPEPAYRERGRTRAREGALEDRPRGLARGPFRVHERRHRSAGVARARRDWNGLRARGFHLAHARRRTSARQAAAGPAGCAPGAGAAVHPLARRLVRLDLQVEGRHRSRGLTQVQPEHDLGRLLRLLRLRHGRVPGALPAARGRANDRAGRHRHGPGTAPVRARVGALPGRSADHRVGPPSRREWPPRALSRALHPDRQRADEPQALTRPVRRDRQSLRPAAAGDRTPVQDRRVRTEALERHELEREADRSRGPELRHPRQPQLRVRT